MRLVADNTQGLILEKLCGLLMEYCVTWDKLDLPYDYCI